MSLADISLIIDYDIVYASLVSLAAAALLLGIIYPTIDERARMQRRAVAITGRRVKTISHDKRSANELQKRKK